MQEGTEMLKTKPERWKYFRLAAAVLPTLIHFIARASGPVMKGRNLKTSSKSRTFLSKPRVPNSRWCYIGKASHLSFLLESLNDGMLPDTLPAPNWARRVCARPPGTALNLARRSGAYLVRQAAARTWLTGRGVIYSSDVVWHRESQAPANLSAAELAFSPRLGGKHQLIPSWLGVLLAPHQRGRHLQSTFPYMNFPLWGLKSSFAPI